MLIALIDTETSGLDVGKHQVLSLAATAIDITRPKQKIVEDFYVEIEYPEYVVAPSAMKVNGINLATWKGDTIEQAMNKFVKWLQSWNTDKYVNLGGHNAAKFDYPHLMHLIKLAYPKGSPIEFSYRVVDTYPIAFMEQIRGKLPSIKLSLESLSEHFQTTSRPNHNALVDIKATAEIFWRLYEM